MIIDPKEALALMDKIEAGAPKPFVAVPSHEDWEQLRKLLSTPKQPTGTNFGG